MTPQDKAQYFKEKANKILGYVHYHESEETTDIALLVVNECILEHCHESEHKNPNAQDRWIEFWLDVKKDLMKPKRNN